MKCPVCGNELEYETYYNGEDTSYCKICTECGYNSRIHGESDDDEDDDFETTSEKKFLVQRKSNGETWASLMTPRELIKYINFSDCYDESYSIYDVSQFGNVIPCHYTGWQRNCLIEVADNNGNIILSGYGEDH